MCVWMPSSLSSLRNRSKFLNILECLSHWWVLYAFVSPLFLQGCNCSNGFAGSSCGRWAQDWHRCFQMNNWVSLKTMPLIISVYQDCSNTLLSSKKLNGNECIVDLHLGSWIWNWIECTLFWLSIWIEPTTLVLLKLCCTI